MGQGQGRGRNDEVWDLRTERRKRGRKKEREKEKGEKERREGRKRRERREKERQGRKKEKGDITVRSQTTSSITSWGEGWLGPSGLKVRTARYTWAISRESRRQAETPPSFISTERAVPFLKTKGCACQRTDSQVVRLTSWLCLVDRTYLIRQSYWGMSSTGFLQGGSLRLDTLRDSGHELYNTCIITSLLESRLASCTYYCIGHS